MTANQGFALHPGAALDITEIWEFIAKDNPLAARSVREDILDAIRKLVPFPKPGSPTDRSHIMPAALPDRAQLSYRLCARCKATPRACGASRRPQPACDGGHSARKEVNREFSNHVSGLPRTLRDAKVLLFCIVCVLFTCCLRNQQRLSGT